MGKNAELGQALIESLLVCLLFVSVLVIADQMVLHQRDRQKKQLINKYKNSKLSEVQFSKNEDNLTQGE